LFLCKRLKSHWTNEKQGEKNLKRKRNGIQKEDAEKGERQEKVGLLVE
jgi:hypothetical protein